MLGGQDSADEWLLRRGVYLIQMLLGCRLGHELLNAIVESAINQQICSGIMGLGKTAAVERRPFSQTRRRAKVDDLKLVTYHRRLVNFRRPLGLPPQLAPAFYERNSIFVEKFACLHR